MISRPESRIFMITYGLILGQNHGQDRGQNDISK